MVKGQFPFPLPLTVQLELRHSVRQYTQINTQTIIIRTRKMQDAFWNNFKTFKGLFLSSKFRNNVYNARPQSIIGETADAQLVP